MAIFGNSKTQTDEVERLRRAVEELSILNDLARAISVSQDSDEIMKTIINRSVKAVSAEEASITMVDHDEMVPTGTLIWERSGGGGDEHYHLNRNVLGCMCHEKRSLLVNDPEGDPRFKGIRVAEGIRNFLCVPLMVGAELIGVLSAYNKIGDDFNPDDQRVLAIIATQSAQVLEKARLDHEAKSADRIREDMRLAEIIQERSRLRRGRGLTGRRTCGWRLFRFHSPAGQSLGHRPWRRFRERCSRRPVDGQPPGHPAQSGAAGHLLPQMHGQLQPPAVSQHFP